MIDQQNIYVGGITESKKRNVMIVSITVCMLLLLFAGCGDDDMIKPQEETGTIVIDQTPDVLSGAGWSLTGLKSEAGSGDITLAEMPTGPYKLTWNIVGGFSKPPSYKKILSSNGSITFSGAYVQVPGPSGEFVLIPAGTFRMGSEDKTQHTVTLTTPFYISNTEVTNQKYIELAQWAYDQGHCTATGVKLHDNLDGSTMLIMDLEADSCEISFAGGTFSVDAGKEEHPVMHVTWHCAAAYCDWLSLKEGLPRAYNHTTWLCNGHDPYNAQGYRLPTEAEWEYACRAGTQTPFYTGNCLDSDTEANYCGEWPYPGCSSGSVIGWTVPVGSYPANTYGLYDMHGNLFEWCNEWYGSYSGDEIDPAGPDTGPGRVIRGGFWLSEAMRCSSANRGVSYPENSRPAFGFRPVRSFD